MAFSYGVKFADQWRGIDPDGIKRHWAQKLFVLKTEELTRGVQRLDTRTFPPTLPEFLSLCRPPVDPLVAFHEAMEQGIKRERGEPDVWSSPAVFWAWRKIGATECARQPYAMLKSRWEAALAAELEREVIEPIPAQDPLSLPAPGKTMLSSRKAQELIGDFKLKGLGDAASGDSRRWARRILERRAAGKADFSMFVIECAERELGLRA